MQNASMICVGRRSGMSEHGSVLAWCANSSRNNNNNNNNVCVVGMEVRGEEEGRPSGHEI